MLELLAQGRRYLWSAWRFRWLSIAVAWLVCLGGWAAVSMMPNQYEADARLYVDADAVLTPLLKGLALDNTVSSQLDLLQRTLLSRPNLEKLISKTDLELSVSGPTDMERLVAQLGNQIRLVPQSHDLFTISYHNTNPQLAYDVVQNILNIFIEAKSGSNRSDMENARVFLQQQIASYEAQLRSAEAKRAAFKGKYVEILPSDLNGASRLEEARSQVSQLQGQLIDAQSRRKMLADELAGTPQMNVTEVDPGSPGGVVGGQSELAAAQEKLAILLQTDTDANPDVIRQRALIAGLRASGGGATPRGGTAGRPARSVSVPNPVYDQLKVSLVETDAELASLQRRVASATQDRDRLEAIARDVPNVQAQSLSLDRDYDVLRKNYDELISRRESMRIAAAADTDADKVRLEVIDPPQLPRIPVGPHRLMLLSGVLVAGLGAGVAVALLLGRLDSAFYTLAELRSLGLPVAGGISLAGPARRFTGRMLVGAVLPALAVVLLFGTFGGLLVRLARSLA
jgi:polysaccharide chain length determinant protein (PEP-CTERM system associated)